MVVGNELPQVAGARNRRSLERRKVFLSWVVPRGGDVGGAGPANG